MKRFLHCRHILFICFLFLAGLPRSSEAQILITASLDGATAGTASSGRGTMWGVLSPDLKTLTYLITYQNLQGNFTAAHFHSESGAVVESISFGTSNTASGVWSNIPDSLLGQFFSGHGIYVNIHTSAFPAGEIQGRCSPHQGGFVIAMNGGSAGTNSTGLGTGWVVFDSDSQDSSFNKITYDFTYAGLQGSFTGAHFHSSLTTNVVEGIAFTDSSASGSITGMPDSIWAMFIRGNIYANIHTNVYPEGEISGTLIPVGQLGFRAALDNSQAGTASTATGTAWAALNLGTLDVHYSVTYAGLSSAFTAAHIHRASGIVHPITFIGNTADEDWTGLADQDLVDLVLGRLYVNIHSNTYPVGEISGTLISHDGVLTTTMDGSQAGTSSTATGTAWATFGDSLRYRATIAGLNGTYTAAHFHLSPEGSVLMPASFTDSTASGYWNNPDSITTLFIENRIYLNVHSNFAPAGEISGTMHLGYEQVITSVKKNISAGVPALYSLDQNYPNPFNPSTTINFQLPKSARITLKVYNLVGQEVASLVDGIKSAGSYAVKFNASHLASGMYFYRLNSSDGFTAVKKMLMLK